MNKEQEIVISMVGLLLMGGWFTYMGYFAKTKKGEPALNSVALAKARVLGPICLMFFLWLLFKLLFEAL
ncbi:MAG: hypothetical protein MUD08_09400 [Cytophagales bacterium]|jgi:hypothetical protein|nr:hypothetical protein [Cytophagales bacterium]